MTSSIQDNSKLETVRVSKQGGRGVNGFPQFHVIFKKRKTKINSKQIY